MRKTCHWLVFLGGIISAISIFLIMLVMTYEVICRYVLNAPTTWVLEVVSYLLVTSTCMGLAYTLRVQAHIAVDVVRKLFPIPVQQLLYRLSLMVIVAVSLAIIFWGWIDVMASKLLGDVSLTPLAMPLWIPQIVIPVGAFLLLIQTVELLFDKNILTSATDPELNQEGRQS
jgi:TRAP-type C4-dicarboxylate transport system permease small subunit